MTASQVSSSPTGGVVVGEAEVVVEALGAGTVNVSVTGSAGAWPPHPVSATVNMRAPATSVRRWNDAVDRMEFPLEFVFPLTEGSRVADRPAPRGRTAINRSSNSQRGAPVTIHRSVCTRIPRSTARIAMKPVKASHSHSMAYRMPRTGGSVESSQGPIAYTAKMSGR